MTNAIVGIHISVGYGKQDILADQSVSIPAGKITGLIGPNGSGKSTLLKALCGIKPLRKGTVVINDQPLDQLSSRQRAKQIAYLAQTPNVPGDLTVQNLVKLGRYAYCHGFFNRDENAREQVLSALVSANVVELANTRIDSLSGGQRQRAFIAMTLAHNSPIIMLDEPTTYLDLTHQLEILQLLQQLNQRQHKTVVLVLHDLNQAARFCDQLVCMKDGQAVSTGTPREVLTDRLLAEIFQIKAEITYQQKYHYPQLLNYETLVAQ